MSNATLSKDFQIGIRRPERFSVVGETSAYGLELTGLETEDKTMFPNYFSEVRPTLLHYIYNTFVKIIVGDFINPKIDDKHIIDEKSNIYSHYQIILTDLLLTKIEDRNALTAFSNNDLLTSRMMDLCIRESFEVKLWNDVKHLISINKFDLAYFNLFEELRKQVIAKNYTNCNRFLVHVYGEDLNTDSIVHILNILSIVKEHLSFWDTFVKTATKTLEEREGKHETSVLLKVIL